MARPKEFDTDAALEKAMELFWLQGYQATTLPDLVERMGIGRQSLYDTFGDKRQLFLRALDRYSDVLITGVLGALEGPDAGLDAILRFLDTVVAYQTGKPVRTACLMVNSTMEMALSDPEVASRSAAYRRRMVNAFRHALTNAETAGDITPALPVDSLAQHLTATVFGMIVAAKAGSDTEALRQMAQGALLVAGAPQPTALPNS
ncbi:MAG: TetR/AcrR family transcriptional regulator [Gemmatimonadales bacterium]